MELTARQERFLARLISLLESTDVETLEPLELARRLAVPPQAIKAILKLGLERGDLIQVAPTQVYSPGQIEAIERKLQGLFGHEWFDVATFRKELGISRKYADPLFIFFEANGLFEREGPKVRLNRSP